MSDDQRIASLLYGNTTTPAKAPAAASPLDELVKKFYGEPAAPPATPPASGLGFDRYAALKSNLDKHGEVLHDTLGLGAEARDSDNRAFVQLADDLGFDDQTLLTLHDQVVRGLTQAPEGDGDETAAEDTRNAAVRQTLREQLGEDKAADVIERTQRFIDATPDLERLVNRGAVATRGDAFLTIAQHVQDKHIR